MSGSSASTQQPIEGAPPGFLASLIGLAKAIVYPFDQVLTGMVTAGLCLEALCQFLGLTRSALYGHVVRLGLRTPADRPVRSAGPRGWPVEDVRTVIKLRPIGVHPEIIGQCLSQPRNAGAVRAKCRRIGLAAPPRKSLFRPDPAELRRLLGLDPLAETQSPSERCGRTAGPALPGFEPSQPATLKPTRRGSPAQPPVRVEGQRELGLHGIIAGTEHVRANVLDTPSIRPSPRLTPFTAAASQQFPASVAELDFNALTWIGDLRSPGVNEVAVYAIGMLIMSGLHYSVVARMTGKSPAAVRTIRTRIGVPVDGKFREKSTDIFDSDAADATRVLGGWIVRRGPATDDQRGLPTYFWVHKNDFRTRLPPTKRKRDRQIEGRSPIMEIITRAMIDEAAAKGEPIWPITKPFAVAS